AECWRFPYAFRGHSGASDAPSRRRKARRHQDDWRQAKRCVSPILQLRSESRAQERFAALEAKMLPLSDDADDVIARRELTKRPRHPASGKGNGSELLTGTESLMETRDEWSRPPICARIKWDCLCVRWVRAGARVFESPVMSVSLA